MTQNINRNLADSSLLLTNEEAQEDNMNIVIFGHPATDVDGNPRIGKKPLTLTIGKCENRVEEKIQNSTLKKSKKLEKYQTDDREMAKRLKVMIDSDKFLWHFVDTLRGHSGSPCLIMTREGLKVAAIHTGGVYCKTINSNKELMDSNLVVNHARKLQKFDGIFQTFPPSDD